MTTYRVTRSNGLVCLSLALAALLSSARAASAAIVTVTAFGSPAFVAAPTWRPVDFVTYSGATDFSDAFRILPPPNHQFHPDLGVGPGAPHGPPYDTEISAGLAAAGIAEKTVFSVEEFDGSLGNGVFTAFMVIANPANAPTGLTPDGVTRMIPNALFPITLDITVSRNGVVFDAFGVAVPPLDASLNPPFFVDGHSHFPVFLEEDSTFLPPDTDPIGEYVFRVVLTDQQGNGFVVTSSFSVVPEPSSLLLLGVGLAGVAGYRWRRGADHSPSTAAAAGGRGASR